jgi:hypothetical protein
MNKRNIICDLDGTLADLTHRLHHVKGEKKNWDAFHAECVNDKPHDDVIQILLQLERVDCGCYNPQDCGCEPRHNNVYILSGRNEVVRDETVCWLEQHVALHGIYVGGFNYNSNLVMRKANDHRPDTEVKRDMVRELGLTPDNTLCVFDDRQCVVDMWRELGFRCLQVQAWSE